MCLAGGMTHQFTPFFRAFFMMVLFVGLWGPAEAQIRDLGPINGVQLKLCRHHADRHCVIDGDTFRLGSTSIRIADIDTPETHPPHCPLEAKLGRQATLRLQALLNAGQFELRGISRDEDRYGRKLRLVMRDERSLGMVLVDEGLARRYHGQRRKGWCGA